MVLIIHANKRKAQAISDIFYYMGVLSYAATPTEAYLEISEHYRVALVVDPEELPDAESFVDKLRSYCRGVPIFSICAHQSCRDLSAFFDGCLPDNIYSSTLIEEIVRYQKEHNLPLSTKYTMAGIDASCDADAARIFDTPITFTKTETMILRYLTVAYPEPKDAYSILRYAFKPLRKPEETSIRTHISVMNKKFRAINGRNLFLAIPNEGYVISTPEMLSAYKTAN